MRGENILAILGIDPSVISTVIIFPINSYFTKLAYILRNIF